MRLALEEEVDQVSAALLGREVEVEAAVEPAGSHERGVERVGSVRRRDEQDVVVARLRGLHRPAGREVSLDPPEHAVAKLVDEPWLVERLHLDQELVDHAARSLGERLVDLHALAALAAFRPGRHAQSATSRPDRVDLLDETDGATVLPCRLAKRPEERADLDGGHPVEHRLERWCRHEEEGDTGLLGHGLGHERLAGSGRAFEQDPPPWIPSQHVTERRVAQEDVQAADDLLDLSV